MFVFGFCKQIQKEQNRHWHSVFFFWPFWSLTACGLNRKQLLEYSLKLPKNMSYRFGMTWDHHCTICLTYPPSMILCNNVFHLSCGQIIVKQLTQTVRGPRTVFTPAALYAGLVVRIQTIVCVIKVVRVWRGFLWSYMVGCVCVCVCADGAIWQLVHAGALTPKSTIHTQLQITQHTEPYRQHWKIKQ